MDLDRFFPGEEPFYFLRGQIHHLPDGKIFKVKADLVAGFFARGSASTGRSTVWITAWKSQPRPKAPRRSAPGWYPRQGDRIQPCPAQAGVEQQILDLQAAIHRAFGQSGIFQNRQHQAIETRFLPGTFFEDTCQKCCRSSGTIQPQ